MRGAFWRMTASRLLQAVLALLLLTLVVRVAVFALPGDPIRPLFGVGRADPAELARLRDFYGLDEPFWRQYGDYLFGLLRGDLGPLYGGGEVADAVLGSLPSTLRLVGTVMVAQVLVGTPLGAVAASRRGWLDRALSGFTALAVAVPVFAVAEVLQRTVGYDLRWLPGSGTVGGWRSYMLPSVVLAVIPVVLHARLVRGALREVLHAPYIRRAVASGFSGARILWVHALRVTVPGAVALAGAQAGTLLSGAVIVETVFKLPGLGSLLVSGVRGRQGPLVAGSVLALAAVIILMTLAADVLSWRADPRTPAGGNQEQ